MEEQLVFLAFSALAAAVLTFAISFGLARFLSRKFKDMSITGIDVHKPDKPVTAEMGGVAILAGVALGALSFYAIDASAVSLLFVAGILTVLLVGVVGLVDDLVALRQRYKPFLVAAMSIPVSVALFSRSEIYFPLIGHVSFGYLYPLIVVPLAIATSSNLSNMLAGFNGLEAGCATIAIGALTLLSAWKGNEAGTMLGCLFLAGYVGFLLLNWYPSKIFPGDTGTLMAGAGIATIGVVSGLEFAAVVVSIPAAFDFTLKMLTKNPFSARSIHGNTAVATDGTLVPPDYPALSHAFMKVTKMSERSLVESIIAMELVYAILAIVITVSI